MNEATPSKDPDARERVVAATRSAFAQSDPATILALLDLYGVGPHERERERVQLAIVALSLGQEEKLLDLVQAAKTDYRDILLWHATGPLTPEQGAREQQAARRLIEQWDRK